MCQSKPMDGYKHQTHNMYCNGAVRNIEIQRNLGIYKDWTFRFYVNNTVPENVIKILKHFKAEIVDMTGSRECFGVFCLMILLLIYLLSEM